MLRTRIHAGWVLSALIMVGATAFAQLNCNVGVQFYANGGIKGCNLNGHHRLYAASGLALTCANGHEAELYPDGRLKSCTLAQPLSTADRRCVAGSRLELNPDGTLKRCTAG